MPPTDHMPIGILNVHIQDPPEGRDLKLLRALLDERVILTFGPDVPTDAGYDVLVAGRPTDPELNASSSLRMLVIPWAGLAQSTRLAMLERPEVAVHNIHHNAAPAAEMAVALMLAAAKSVVPIDRDLRRDDWSPRYEPDRAVLLEGRRALILGYGAIGRRVASVCRALGMSVTATKRRLDDVPPDCPDRVLPPDALHDLLPEADVLHVALPHTNATRGLIGERELSLLPRDAVLVNVARAPIVDEEALFRALERRSIRAAGLDVWYAYPRSDEERRSTPPSVFPFRDLDNVVMSPHRAGAFAVRGVEEARVAALAETLNAAVRGDPVPHPVDVREGY
jgi:phosphoglycerate dehydrogenase-like enzyme